MPADPDPLTPERVAVLRFAARHEGWTDAALTARVREAFGCDLIRYRQRLVYAVKLPGAEAIEPGLVHRLRGVLEARAARFTRHRPATRGV